MVRLDHSVVSPYQKKSIYLHVVRRNGTHKPISVFRSSRGLVYDNLYDRGQVYDGFSCYSYICITFVSFKTKSTEALWFM